MYDRYTTVTISAPAVHTLFRPGTIISVRYEYNGPDDVTETEVIIVVPEVCACAGQKPADQELTACPDCLPDLFGIGHTLMSVQIPSGPCPYCGAALDREHGHGGCLTPETYGGGGR